jgi:molecular chaperone Hsp33
VIRLAAAPLFLAGDPAPHWRAGGIMLQMTPEAAGQPGKEGEGPSDDWQRLALLLKTVEDLELVDTSLPPETLLWRLFHEDEVRVEPPERVIFRCDCDPVRIVQVLKSYTPADRQGLADPDGVIRARCEFCGKTHEIPPEALT